MRATLFWLLMLPLSCFAQKNAGEQKRPPYVVKTTPLNLINPFQQSVDVSADIPLSSRWGLEMGIGLVLDSWSWAPHKGETYKGLKLKPAIKYYTQLLTGGNNDYISLAFKYNNIQNSRYVNVTRQGGQYTEWMFQRKHLLTWGAAFRMGSQLYLGNRKRWMIEPFVGAGIRQLRVSQHDLPLDAELLVEERIFNLDRPSGIYTTPDISLGFCFGWAIPAKIN